MSAVDRAKYFHTYNPNQSLGILKYIDVKKAIKYKSLQHLQQITNTCQRMKINTFWYQKQTLQNKLKFIQSYQFSLCYSKNLKNIYDQKEIQFQQLNKRLKSQVQEKKQSIRQHKKKVEQMKEDYRSLKIQQSKKIYQIYQKKLENIKFQQEELIEVKENMKKQIQQRKKQLQKNQTPKIIYYYPYPPYPQQQPNYNPNTIPQQKYNANGENYSNHVNPTTNNHNYIANQEKTHKKQASYKNNVNENLFVNSKDKRQKGISKIENPKDLEGLQLPEQNEGKIEHKNIGQSKNSNKIENPLSILKLGSEKLMKKISQGSNGHILEQQQQANMKSNIAQKIQGIMHKSSQNENNIKSNQLTNSKQNKSQSFEKSSIELIQAYNNQEQKYAIYQDEQPEFKSLHVHSPTNQISSIKINKQLEQNFKNTDKSNNQEEIDKVCQLRDVYQSKKKSPTNKMSSSKQILTVQEDQSQIMTGYDSFFDKKLLLDSKIQSKISLQDSSKKTNGKLVDFNKIKRKNSKDSQKQQSSPRNHNSFQSQDKNKNIRYSQLSIHEANLLCSTKGQYGDFQKIAVLKSKPIRKMQSQKQETREQDNLKKQFGTSDWHQSKAQKQTNRQSLTKKFEAIKINDKLNQISKAQNTKYKIQKQNDSSSEDQFGRLNENSNIGNILSNKLNKKAMSFKDEIKQSIQIVKQKNQPTKQQIPKDYDEQYEPDFQTSKQQTNSLIKINLKQVSRDQIKTRSIENTPRDKSRIEIDFQNSLGDAIIDDSPFAQLLNQRFQLKSEVQGTLNKLTCTNINQQKGLFASSLRLNQFQQSKINIRLKTEQNIEPNEDFLDQIEMPMNSVVGKKPEGLRKTALLTPYQMKQSNFSNGTIQELKRNTQSLSLPFQSIQKSIQSNGSLLIPQRSLKSLNAQQQSKSKQLQKSKQSQGLIQSTIFVDNNIISSNKQKQRKNPKLIESQNLPQINKSTLQSLAFAPIYSSKNNQNQVKQEIQEQLQFNLEDSSKIQQFEKQQIEKQLIKIIRNKNKNPEGSQIKLEQKKKQIQTNIEKQISEAMKKNINQIKNWKQVENIFSNKIVSMKIKEESSKRQVQQKIDQIEREIKINQNQKQQKKRQINEKSKDKQVNQKEKIRKSAANLKQADENELSYSASLIKDFNKSNNNISKKSLLPNQSSNSYIQINQFNISEKQKSKIDIKIKSPDQFPKKTLLPQSTILMNKQDDEDQFGQLMQKTKIGQKRKQQSLDQVRSNKFSQRSIQYKSNKNEDLPRGNKLLTLDQKYITNQPSKSKYALKSGSQSTKSIHKQTVASKIQESKYRSIEDPLANQLIKAPNLSKNTKKEQEDDW